MADYASAADFLATFDSEIAKAGLLVREASVAGAPAMSECRVAVRVPDHPSVEVAARIAAVVSGVGVAVVFEGVPAALAELAGQLRAPETPVANEPGESPGPLSERLRAMTVPQKMQLALSGSREERFALLRDTNKTLHVFVLKNPRIGVDEVIWAAKLTTLSPEALKLISENREWNGNASVLIALVRNPKTPLSIAVHLIERLPMSEIRAIAKGGAREQIVHAARKRVNG